MLCVLQNNINLQNYSYIVNDNYLRTITAKKELDALHFPYK